MSELKSWRATDSADLLSTQRHRHAPAGALSAANALARCDFDQPRPGQNGADSTDVRGHNLRQLRLQRNLDPALLATQACISLRQLHQLETGEHSLFYSTGLRNQAGRRVAALLGARWDELDSALPPPRQGTHLKLVTAPVPDTSDAPSSLNMPTGLGKPADETLVVQAEATPRHPARHPGTTPPQRKRPPAWGLAGGLLALLAVSGMAAHALRDGRIQASAPSSAQATSPRS